MAIKGPTACQAQADNGEHPPPDESPKRSARETNKNDNFETNDKASTTKKIKSNIKLAGMQAPSRVLQQVTTPAESQSELFADAFGPGFSYKEPFFISAFFFF